jgi:hypothetical protein
MLPSMPRTNSSSRAAENPSRRSAKMRGRHLSSMLVVGFASVGIQKAGTFFSNCGTCNQWMLDGQHMPLVGNEVNRFATFVTEGVTRA